MDPPPKRIPILFLAVLFVVLILVDQVTKIWAQAALEPSGKVITILPGFCSFNFCRNEVTGWFAYAFRAFLSFLLFIWLIACLKMDSPKTLVLGAFLLLAFSISNGIVDVFCLGYVRDFIHLHGVGVGNVADQYRNLGLLLSVLGSLQVGGKQMGWGRLLLYTLIVLTGIVLFYRYLFRHVGI